MYFIVYETTNVINGKKYRGVHKTKKLYDGYLGSGVLIKRAVEKYGIENFKREILMECISEKEMYEVEKQYVNKEWISSNETYNIMIGGKGGWGHISVTGENNPFYGKKHTDASKKKISDKNVGRLIGEKNPMYGVKLSGCKNGMYGKHHKDISKKKMLGKRPNGKYNNPKSESHKLSLSIAAKNRQPMSEETKIKMSDSQKRRWRKNEV